jgi:glycosyltransferase involved in cell wall biosynthesis/GT2 family glycosyltransferase
VHSLEPSLVWICNGSPWLLAHAAELRRVCAGIPIVDQQVYDTHAGWIEHYADPGIQSFDRFVAINQQIERVFRERIGIPASRIDLIYHGIDADRFHPDRAAALRSEAGAAALGLPPGVPLFAMVGRLTAQKRPLEFLTLARDARDAGLEAHFVLVGDGELAAECDAFVARHALDHVHRIPYCDDMSRVFPLLAGLVICSEYEGLPISMLEALAMGVPVLSTPVGDVPLVLNEYRSGQLVGRAPQPAEWLAAFRAFVAALPALRACAQAAAPRVAERFSSTAAASAYRQSFERAIEERADGAVRDGAARAARPMPPMSVVIPTYNRGALLEDTLRKCRACAGRVDLEFVVIDDGSRDDTAERLEALAKEMPNLTWRSVPNGGPGKARNLGASLAKHDVILFLGDDIQPKDDRFFATHAELHARRPERSFAALGKVVWPNRAGGDVSFVMAHVQGRQGEQFGYADLQPYSFLDWRFFYTANVSVKRALVDDWISEGFSSAFSLAAYEDAELAYRMMQRDDPMKLFYTPGSVGTHHHPFSVESFMSRQQGCGLMARVFLDMHPSSEVQHMIGLGGVAHALATQPHPVGSRNVAHFLSVIEGIKSWVQLVDQHQQFGSQWWHDDLLRGVFKLCYLQGYVMGATGPRDNVSAAYYLMLDEFVRSMNQAIHVELTGRVLGGRDVEGLFSLTPLPTPVTLSPLRAWLMRHPTLMRVARSVRNRLRGL